jgi:hypothetical protein
MATTALSDKTTFAQSTPALQAYQILRLAFTIAPVVAGLDKFTNLLVDWSEYLAPIWTTILPLSPDGFMYLIGVVEIAAGLIVYFRPRFGGYLVMVWLWGIILNLLLLPGYFDVALRDFGLSLGALALARLSETFGPS